MKSTHRKLFLSLAIIVGIATVDATAATKITGIVANQKPIITNKIEINPIDIGPTIIAGRSIIDRRIVVNNIDIQASLPIIL